MLNENMNVENEELMEALEDIDLEVVTGGRTVLHVKRGTLHVHARPSSGSAVLCTVDKYDDLVCMGEAQKDGNGKTWIKVKVNGCVGWVRGDKTKR